MKQQNRSHISCCFLITAALKDGAAPNCCIRDAIVAHLAERREPNPGKKLQPFHYGRLLKVESMDIYQFELCVFSINTLCHVLYASVALSQSSRCVLADI